MGNVLGIDLSMTCTGIAVLYDQGGRVGDAQYETITTATVKSKGTRADTLTDRAWRIRDMRDRIVDWAGMSVRLAVIESPSFGSSGAGTWDRAGLWWAVTSWLVSHEIPVAMTSPLSLKKWACNNGRADKNEVKAAVEELFGLEVRTNDESDAMALAHAGAYHLGIPGLPAADHHDLKLLEKMKWPDLPTDREPCSC